VSNILFFGIINMNSERMANVSLLMDAMQNAGITNPYLQAAILGVVGKESKFLPKDERCYNNTSNERIRGVFGAKVGGYTESELTTLKKDCEAFFNVVYGGRYGNMGNDGYKYRGRGFNQLTFRGSYKSIGDKIGVNLVANPDLVNSPDVAAKVMIEFLKGRFAQTQYVKQYIDNGVVNDAPDLDSAIRVAAHANAGWGKSSSGSAVTRAIDHAYPIAEDALKIYIGIPPSIADPDIAPDFVATPNPIMVNLPPIQVAGYNLDEKSQIYLLGAALVVIGLGVVLVRKQQQQQPIPYYYE
jgi:predicted chitinase